MLLNEAHALVWLKGASTCASFLLGGQEARNHAAINLLHFHHPPDDGINQRRQRLLSTMKQLFKSIPDVEGAARSLARYAVVKPWQALAILRETTKMVS